MPTSNQHSTVSGTGVERGERGGQEWPWRKHVKPQREGRIVDGEEGGKQGPAGLGVTVKR